MHHHCNDVRHQPQQEAALPSTLWWWILYTDQHFVLALHCPSIVSVVGVIQDPEHFSSTPLEQDLWRYLQKLTVIASEIGLPRRPAKPTAVSATEKVLRLQRNLPEWLRFRTTWLSETAAVAPWPLDASAACLHLKTHSILLSLRSTDQSIALGPASPEAAQSDHGLLQVEHCCCEILYAFHYFRVRAVASIDCWFMCHQAYHAAMLLLGRLKRGDPMYFQLAYQTYDTLSQIGQMYGNALVRTLAQKLEHSIAAVSPQTHSDVSTHDDHRLPVRNRVFSLASADQAHQHHEQGPNICTAQPNDLCTVANSQGQRCSTHDRTSTRTGAFTAYRGDGNEHNTSRKGQFRKQRKPSGDKLAPARGLSDATVAAQSSSFQQSSTGVPFAESVSCLSEPGPGVVEYGSMLSTLDAWSTIGATPTTASISIPVSNLDGTVQGFSAVSEDANLALSDMHSYPSSNFTSSSCSSLLTPSTSYPVSPGASKGLTTQTYSLGRSQQNLGSLSFGEEQTMDHDLMWSSYSHGSV